MRVTGKLVLLTLLLSVVSLLCGTYVKGTPTLFEPKFEQSIKEAGIEVKTGDKKESRSVQFLDFDDDLFGDAPFVSQHGLCAGCGTAIAQGRHVAILGQVPKYLLYCCLKVFFC